MKTLEGKVALVTGGNRGIGRAISLELAKHGAVVYFTFLHDEYSARVLSSERGRLFAFRMDVSDRGSVSDVLRQPSMELDILVNNAGINIPTDFDKIGDDEWQQVMDVNLKGPFIMIQEALPILRDGGSIINIASVSGQYGGPRTAHYAASKAGLISLSQVAARFLAHRNIRVNCVSPGLIESPMTQEAGMTTDGILLGRFGLAEEVAKTVAWLASDSASYVTAQTISVNGGLYF